MRKFLVLFLIFSGCQDKSVEVGKTEDGILKYQVELDNGVRDGLITEYYPDGSIQLVGHYKDGLRHGESRQFYEDGRLQAITSWEYGNRTGLFEYYYPDGNILERKHYNAKGEVIYFSRFSNEGEKLSETIVPFFNSNKDTIKIGEEFQLNINFGLELKGNMAVYIGRYEEIDSVNINVTKDTVLTDHGSNTFTYTVTADSLGENIIGLSFDYEKEESDTLDFNKFITDYRFYVIPPEQEYKP